MHVRARGRGRGRGEGDDINRELTLGVISFSSQGSLAHRGLGNTSFARTRRGESLIRGRPERVFTLAECIPSSLFRKDCPARLGFEKRHGINCLNIDASYLIPLPSYRPRSDERSRTSPHLRDP